MIKIHETMWCWHCEHEWETDDYYECKECPNCKVEPVHIMRTSSTVFLYTLIEKEKQRKQNERDNKIDNIIE